MNTPELTPEQERMVEAVGRWADALAESLRPMVELAGRWRLQLWSAYVDAGMPHGATEEGLLRWIREGCRRS